LDNLTALGNLPCDSQARIVDLPMPHKLKTHKASKNNEIKVLKTTDGDIFVCKQGDKACWQRWTSAMTDCV